VTDHRLTRDRRRVALVAAAALVLAAAAALWWMRGADERRVDAACGTWLQQRAQLRTASSESVEAAERARAAHASRAAPYFNDLESTSAALERWSGTSPAVVGSLHAGEDASEMERSTVDALRHIESGVAELRRLISHGSAAGVLDWVPELDARFQNLDDLCLIAARGG
jgi:hypothetical protein